MIASGFPVTDRIKEFVDMSLDEIYKEYGFAFVIKDGKIKGFTR